MIILFCHKEDESLPEVIHRGNAVSKMQLAKKPKTTHYGGFHKAQSSLPEITTTVKVYTNTCT